MGKSLKKFLEGVKALLLKFKVNIKNETKNMKNKIKEIEKRVEMLITNQNLMVDMIDKIIEFQTKNLNKNSFEKSNYIG